MACIVSCWLVVGLYSAAYVCHIVLCCVRMISDSCFVSLFLFVSIVVGMFHVDTALLAHYLGQCYCYCNFSGFTVHSNQPMPLTD